MADILRPESFYTQENQVIYQALQELYEQSKPLDVITTCAQLKKNKTLKKAGGSARIAELANEVLSSANIVAYAKIVAEMALRRRLINLGAELSQAGFDDRFIYGILPCN